MHGPNEFLAPVAALAIYGCGGNSGICAYCLRVDLSYLKLARKGRDAAVHNSREDGLGGVVKIRGEMHLPNFAVKGT